jgi:hypothetical protein
VALVDKSSDADEYVNEGFLRRNREFGGVWLGLSLCAVPLTCSVPMLVSPAGGRVRRRSRRWPGGERGTCKRKLVRITRSRYSGRGHSDPLDPAIYNTGCDAMHNREQILVKVQCYGENKKSGKAGDDN